MTYKYIRGVLITFFLIWLSLYLDDQKQLLIAGFFVISFGVLHGSYDIYLIEFKEESYSFLKVTAAYIVIILLLTFIFYSLHFVSFLIFLGLSSYHFGEQHLKPKLKLNDLYSKITYLSYGFLIFSLFILLKFNTVEKLILVLYGDTISYENFLYLALVNLGVIVGVSFTQKLFLKLDLFIELVILILLIIIIKSTSFYFSFAIYFIVWHSIPSMEDQITLYYGYLNKHSIIQYLKKSFPFWVAAISGLFLYYFVVTTINENQSHTLLVPIIMATTVTHIIVMSIFLNKKRRIDSY